MKGYIDNNYICKGPIIMHQTGKSVMQTARFSDNYNPSESLDSRDIYQNEILDICKIGSYIGLWQLFQAANVLQNPSYQYILNKEIMQLAETQIEECHA